MKKIIIIFLIISSIFLINKFVYKKTINYVSIGDTLNRGVNSYGIIGYGYNDYIKNYLYNNNLLNRFNDGFYNTSITNLTNDIIHNRTIILNNLEFNIKKTLRESDLLVISVGMDELAYYFNNDYQNIENNINIFINNLQKFIKIVNEYAQNNIIFIGYYNPTNNYYSEIDKIFYDLDNRLNALLSEFKIKYIPLYEKIKATNYKDNSNYHLNTRGYLMIAEEIIKYIEKM